MNDSVRGCPARFGLAADHCWRLIWDHLEKRHLFLNFGDHVPERGADADEKGGLIEKRPLDGLSHVCEHVRQVSCCQWTGRAAPRCGALPGSSVSLEIADGRFTVPVDLYDPPWPIPLENAGHAVEMVLDHWVEEPAPGLEQALQALANSEWGRIQEWARYYQQVVTETVRERAAGNERLAAHIDDPRILLADTPTLQRALQAYGLSPTPGTARYLLSITSREFYEQVYPGIQPCPTRGIKVTSFMLRPLPDSVVDHGGICTRVAGSMDWSDASLIRQGQAVATAHKQFWARVCPYPLWPADLRGYSDEGECELDASVFRCARGEMTRTELYRIQEDRLYQRLGRRPSDGEIKRLRKATDERVRRAKNRLRRLLKD